MNHSPLIAPEATLPQAALHEAALRFLISEVPSETLASPSVVLVCDSAEQEAAFRPLLDCWGLGHVGTRVQPPTLALSKPSPLLDAARKVMQRRAAETSAARRPAAQPTGSYTKPTTKARKAARRRVGAGRKASR